MHAPPLPAPPQEESNEFGGTFICNGIERIIRMLVQARIAGARLMAVEEYPL